MIRGKNILFSVSSLGLGHATRVMPIIKHYIDNNKLFVLSTGNSLQLLKEELKNHDVIYVDLKDYPPLGRGKGAMFYVHLFFDLIKTGAMIREEHKFVERLVKKYKIDICFSDCRYGCYSEKAISFAIAHQISFRMQRGLKILQKMADSYNRKHFKKFTKLLIPDYPHKANNLAGIVSHPNFLDDIDHKFVGILSSVQKKKTKKDIDYLFVISGFLQEHIKPFIERLMEEAKSLRGKKVFILGDMSKNDHYKLPNNIEVYSHAPIKLRDKLINRAKVVVSRTGYTTVMDLVELDINGALVPTPNNMEQEYLTEHLGRKKYFLTFKCQKSFTLKDLERKLKTIKRFKTKDRTKKTLMKINKEVEKHL